MFPGAGPSSTDRRANDDVNSALADLDVLGDLHDDELIGKYDAAVIDQDEGKPHIVKRVDHPRIDVLPELVGTGALPRGQLRDAAKELDPGEAALLVVGEPTLEKDSTWRSRGRTRWPRSRTTPRPTNSPMT